MNDWMKPTYTITASQPQYPENTTFEKVPLSVARLSGGLEMSVLYNLTGYAFVAASFASLPAIAFAECRLFEHRDYGGASYTLDNLERMIMVNGDSIGCSVSHGDSDCPSTTYEASWNDHVSSFRVTRGCTLTLWEHINESGARFRSNRSYTYVGSRWNDKASEALCTCD
nr:hypothetical protein [Ensifer sp. WSM1721]